jgi:hypothetical protein
MNGGIRGPSANVVGVCEAKLIVLDAWNTLESAMRKLPPLVRTGSWASRWWVKGSGAGPAPAIRSALSGPGTGAWKM